MKAVLLIRERLVFEDGSRVEMVVWRVPDPVPPSRHRLKYRFAYIADGVRVVGYDNERGKGDHRHILGVEEAVAFTTIEALVAKFLSLVERVRSAQ